MCIRDSYYAEPVYIDALTNSLNAALANLPFKPCLLYTSDAADEEDSVDLGGRRIIKAEDGIRDLVRSRGLGDVYKRQLLRRAGLYRRAHQFAQCGAGEPSLQTRTDRCLVPWHAGELCRQGRSLLSPLQRDHGAAA